MKPTQQHLNEEMCLTTSTIDAANAKLDNGKTPYTNLNSNISLSWVNLRVTVSVWETNSKFSEGSSSLFAKIPTRKRKTILPNLSGHFHLHSLNGVLGPSGAGKSTLLNCLSGRNRPSSGMISYNPFISSNEAKTKSSSSSAPPSIVFIEQNAHESSIITELSVGQLLHYAYCFKNGQLPFCLTGENNNKNKAYQTKLTEVLQAMALPGDILERKFSKCSGGEQRRVALAQELMAEGCRFPDFWFIDEPTSGLDSQSALVVMQCLHWLARAQPITIIASIHVPNEQTLALFDQLVVLAKGGLCIYSGPPSALESTLERALDLKVAHHQKPIEVAIKVAFSGSEDTRRALANDVLTREYNSLNFFFSHQKSSLSQQVISTEHKSSQNQISSPSSSLRGSFRLVDLATHFSRQFSRTFISGWQTLLFQLAFYIGSIILLASVFDRAMIPPDGCFQTMTSSSRLSSVDDDDEENAISNFTNSSSNFCDATPLTEKLLIVENVNYLAFGRIFQAFPLMLNSIAAFGSLARVFRSEHRNKWYSLSSFYWATSLLSLLEMSLVVGVIATMMYFAIGEQAIDGGALNWTRFGHYTFSLWLYYLFHQSIGQFVGVVLLDHFHLAMALGYSLIPMANIFDDYFFKVDDFGSPVFVFVSELVATKYLTRYMLYAFYGVDRCGASRSWFLEKHHVKPQAVPFYILRVLVNIFLMRAVTLAIMYARFGDVFESLKSCFQKKKSTADLEQNKKFKLKLFSEGNCNSTMVTIDMNEGDSIKEEDLVDENNNKIKTLKEKESLENEKEEEKGQILISWQQLTLHRNVSLFGSRKRSSSSPKPILQNLNGHLRLGSLTALIGMSGAGKTSLLRVLNGQLSSRLDERCRFRISNRTKVRTCFIAQQVTLLPGLSVRQTLMYASRLKNSNGFGGGDGGDKGAEEYHRQIADRLLEELGLLEAAETAVQRCSGGELRRLSIAVELTNSTAEAMPTLMCCDEPTTGLDSTSASMIINTLHRISRQHGIAIFASVHQPSPELLATAFDQIYVIAGGGACAYFGPPQGISAHLSRVPAIDQAESRYLIEVLVRYSCLGADHPTVRQLVEVNSELKKEKEKEELFSEETTLEVYEGPCSPRVRFSFTSSLLLLRRYLPHFTGYLWSQAVAFLGIYILWTSALHLFFDPSIGQVDGCFSLEEDFTTTNVCLLSANETARRSVIERGLENNLKYNLFFNNGFYALVTMQTTFLFFADLQVFSTEHRNGYYSSGAFYLAKTITEVLPATILLPLYVYFCDIYSEHLKQSIYWPLLGTFALAVFAAQGLAHAIVLLAPRSLSSVILLNMIAFVGSFLLSNVPVTLNRMHYLYQLVADLSFSRFSNEASFLLEYGFGRCGEGQIQVLLTWMDLAEDDHYRFYRSWLALLANGVLYRVVAIWLLVRFANPKRGRKNGQKQSTLNEDKEGKLSENFQVKKENIV